MPPPINRTPTLSGIDDATRNLVRIAAAIAGGSEQQTRSVMEQAVGSAEAGAIDEVILQSYLFAGFPRALNAARVWRTVSGKPAPTSDFEAEISNASAWVERGEITCRRVYGESYEMLRENIRDLHPALDSWMITDGYGKVLSRPGLDLRTRELCILAACAASGQQRQLHSHLHGALNSGATPSEVIAALDSLTGLVDEDNLVRYRGLLARVLAKRHAPAQQGSANVH